MVAGSVGCVSLGSWGMDCAIARSLRGEERAGRRPRSAEESTLSGDQQPEDCEPRGANFGWFVILQRTFRADSP